MEGVQKAQRLSAPTRPFRGVLAVTTRGPVSDAERRALWEWWNTSGCRDKKLIYSLGRPVEERDRTSYVVVRALRAGVKLEDLL